eukprot:1156621-Pelagomonas_calceolata.AAC.1
MFTRDEIVGKPPAASVTEALEQGHMERAPWKVIGEKHQCNQHEPQRWSGTQQQLQYLKSGRS